ncbi:hypothetical protein CLU90_0993 [Janthinobacterium sp. 67]|uniref:hypothetical protein n=1 Tax=Janthinobacterium sp. 67 TaxID=2035207 RepID=UPI000CC96384|nr:hypothetical protein [Janthinobacterium sp. 67]PJJ17813.1 hypothetical protein CLU90_0993 [Janthinobacterium sp. 67]
MTQDDLKTLGIALGICYAAYKFVGNPMVKGAAVAVGAVVVAKKVPYLSASLA